VIPRDLTAEFPPDVRARGDRYVAERRVQISSARAGTIVALVSGTNDYVVQLTAKTLARSNTGRHVGRHWETLRARR
jgi:uncharacterized Zn finger protein